MKSCSNHERYSLRYRVQHEMWPILLVISVSDHYYAIGDCGGATVESKCGECGAGIGGASHALRGDNAFAPEIDNASAPAWPGMNALGLH